MTTRKDRDKKAAKRVSMAEWAKKQGQSGEGSCIRPPDGVGFTSTNKLSLGVVKLDFLPYKVGKNNPNADEGMEHFEREYQNHWVPTPNGNRSFACRKACFGKRCAVCDWLVKNGGSADPELVQGLRPKRRHLWLVNAKPGDVKNPDIKILETNHQNRGTGFAELMADAVATLDEGTEPFALENGYTAVLRVVEQTMGQGRGKYNGVTRIDLKPHSYDYPADLLDELPCLDDCIVDPGYDEVMALLEPGAAEDDDETSRGKAANDDNDQDDDDDQEEAPRAKAGKNGHRQKTAKELGLAVGDYVDHDEFGECKITRITADGTALILEDEDGDLHKAISPESVAKVETADGGKGGKPVARSGGKKPSRRDDPEDDDDEDEDEDDDQDDQDDQDDDTDDDEDEEENEEDEKPARGKRR